MADESLASPSLVSLENESTIVSADAFIKRKVVSDNIPEDQSMNSQVFSNQMQYAYDDSSLSEFASVTDNSVIKSHPVKKSCRINHNSTHSSSQSLLPSVNADVSNVFSFSSVVGSLPVFDINGRKPFYSKY